MALDLGLYAFENGRSDGNFVHGINPEQCAAVGRPYIYYTRDAVERCTRPLLGELMPPGVSDQDLRKRSCLHRAAFERGDWTTRNGKACEAPIRTFVLIDIRY